MKELAANYIAKVINWLQFNKIKSIKHYVYMIKIF